MDALPLANPRHLALRLDVWRQALAEALYDLEYIDALSGLQRSFDAALSIEVPESSRWPLLRMASETAVDIAQTAPRSIELNKIAANLNSCIKGIGSIIGLHPEERHTPELLAELLALRAKCRRALAAVLYRRGQWSRDTEARIRGYRQDALHDASRAKAVGETPVVLLEYALSLFANSASPTTAKAREAMEVLARLAADPRNFLAVYEYVRQLKMRHAHQAAVDAFTSAAQQDPDRRRFAANLGYFVGAVIGLYYEEPGSARFQQAATDAIAWLEEAIQAGHHRAQEIVDYCYLQALTGQPIERFVAPLEAITDDKGILWTGVGELSFHGTRGEETLREALLLGLEDAFLWNRIGTIYLDFVGNARKAVLCYERAARLDARSPLYHFNKAKALARPGGDFALAQQSLLQARRLSPNMSVWYAVTRPEFDRLQSDIAAHLSG